MDKDIDGKVFQIISFGIVHVKGGFKPLVDSKLKHLA
jgi:hypothetical protein